MFKIEKNIPIPEQTRKKKYPFKDMEVGDSIFVEKEMISRVYSAARTYGSRKGLYFSARKEGNGYRIWRTK